MTTTDPMTLFLCQCEFCLSGIQISGKFEFEDYIDLCNKRNSLDYTEKKIIIHLLANYFKPEHNLEYYQNYYRQIELEAARVPRSNNHLIMFNSQEKELSCLECDGKYQPCVYQDIVKEKICNNIHELGIVTLEEIESEDKFYSSMFRKSVEIVFENDHLEKDVKEYIERRAQLAQEEEIIQQLAEKLGFNNRVTLDKRIWHKVLDMIPELYTTYVQALGQGALLLLFGTIFKMHVETSVKILMSAWNPSHSIMCKMKMTAG